MEDDELLDDQADSDGDNDGDDSGSDNSAPPTDKPDAKDEGKRVNDLMSKWQAEQARANRLERELAKARGGDSGSTGADTQGDAGNDRVSEFEEFARENARITLFNSDPRLAEAGLQPGDIAGTTLAEMRASKDKHLKLIGGIEGRLRNRLLSEHGLDPEVATGAGTEQAPSFSTMSDEEFAKFLAARDARPR